MTWIVQVQAPFPARRSCLSRVTCVSCLVAAQVSGQGHQIMSGSSAPPRAGPAGRGSVDDFCLGLGDGIRAVGAAINWHGRSVGHLRGAGTWMGLIFLIREAGSGGDCASLEGDAMMALQRGGESPVIGLRRRHCGMDSAGGRRRSTSTPRRWGTVTSRACLPRQSRHQKKGPPSSLTSVEPVLTWPQKGGRKSRTCGQRGAAVTCLNSHFNSRVRVKAC